MGIIMLGEASANTMSSEEYVQQLDEDLAATARLVLAVMREELPEATETVTEGMVLFSVEGEEVTGIVARDSAYELFVPQMAILDEFSSKLGKVEAGEDCIRFKRLADVSEAQLRRMIRNQSSI